MKNKLVHLGIITIFCSLYFLVATISMINSVAFFDLAHEGMMNWSLAIGFELGAAASLAAIIILDKTNRFMVWTLFLLLTAFQMMANSYHAFVNLEAYMGWIELFGLEEMEPLAQKRILAVVSGAVLPVVALGFIKSLVDYIRPENESTIKEDEFSFVDNNSSPSTELTEPKENMKRDPILEKQVEEIKQIQRERIKEKAKNLETLPKAEPPQSLKERVRENQEKLKSTITPTNPTQFNDPNPTIPVHEQTIEEQSIGTEVNVRIEGDTTYVTTDPSKKPHLPGGSTMNNQ